MSTSTTSKEKKKFPSSKKQNNRANTVEIVKRNRKVELKKADLIPLLSRFEGELQAKDIALAVLKSEKVQLILSVCQMTQLNHQTDPHLALFRDSEYIQKGILNASNLMKNFYETRLAELIIQQTRQVQVLKNELELMQKQCSTLNEQLENEKKNRIQFKEYRKQLQTCEEEKLQLKNELQNTKLHSNEVEQQLMEITKLLEFEHERHKKFVVLLLNERQAENNHFKQQLKQLTKNHLNTDTQHENKFKEFESKYEQEKQILLERIKQLQNENELLIKEKKQQSISNSNQCHSKSQAIVHSTDNVSPIETTIKSENYSPTIVQSSSTVLMRSKTSSPSFPTRTQQVLSMASSASSISPAPQRRSIFVRPTSNVSLSSSAPEHSFQTISSARLAKVAQQFMKPAIQNTSVKQTNQTSFASDYRNNSVQTLLDTLQTVTKNRIKISTITTDSKSISSSSDNSIFQITETGNSEQLYNLLQHGSNPNSQMINGNTCLHISASHGYIQCIRYLLQFGANMFQENDLGVTPWNNLFLLNENIQLECLQEILNHFEISPSVDLIFNAIEKNRMKIFDYLLVVFHEQFKNDSSSLFRLIRFVLRSSNTHFLQNVLHLITVQDLLQIIDSNTFISNECLIFLSSVDDTEDIQTDQTKSIKTMIFISSSNGEHQFSYAIGFISITANISWLELERSCSKIYLDYIAQLESPFGYENSPLGYSANNIDTLAFGSIKWHYQDSPNDDSLLPFDIARDHNSIIINLKGLDTNSTESLAYNYFIPNQNLKLFIRTIDQHTYVGVHGAAYLQKKSLFRDLMKYMTRPVAHSTSPKFKVIQFEFEIITSLDDCIDKLLEHDFLRFNEWKSTDFPSNHSIKFLLFFVNIQNSTGNDMINILLNGETVSKVCHKFSYTREDNPNSTLIYYFPAIFHLCVTTTKRIDTGIYKRFKWIPFKIDSSPWNGVLKRHLWRRMIDMNIRENRSTDQELMNTIQWISNVWQRYNECLPKFSLQDAAVGPALFFDCPMDREAIFEWLQTKWNTIIVPLVREYSINKHNQSKTKDSKTIAQSLRDHHFQDSSQYEAAIGRSLYTLLQRAVSRDCTLTEDEKEQYLLSFIGSRVDGNSGSSTTSSRVGSPQSSVNSDFGAVNWNDERSTIN